MSKQTVLSSCGANSANQVIRLLSIPLLVLVLFTPNTEAKPNYSKRAQNAFITSVRESFIRNGYPGLANKVPVQRTLNLGYFVCNALDQGRTVASIRNQLADSTINSSSDLTAGYYGSTMASASIFLCPEHEAKVRAAYGNP